MHVVVVVRVLHYAYSLRRAPIYIYIWIFVSFWSLVILARKCECNVKARRCHSASARIAVWRSLWRSALWALWQLAVAAAGRRKNGEREAASDCKTSQLHGTRH